MNTTTNGVKHTNGIAPRSALEELIGSIPDPVEEEKKKVEPLPYMTWDEIMEPLPPIPWLIRDMRLAPGGAACIGGFGYSGKSFLAMAIALSVASGRPLFGVYPVRQGTVVHLDYEQGQQVTRRRYQALARGLGISREEIGDRIRFIPLPKVKLDSPGAIDILGASMEGCDLAIIDSFRAAAPSVEENSSDARVPIDEIAAACDPLGCLPLFILHSGKETREDARMALRGSSGLYDTFSTVWIIESDKDPMSSLPKRAFLTKDRFNGTPLLPFGFHLKTEGNVDDTTHKTRLVHVAPEAVEQAKEESKAENERRARVALRRKLANFLGAQPNRTFVGTRAELAKGCEIRNNDLTDPIRELEEEGRLVRDTGTSFRLREITEQTDPECGDVLLP